MTRTIYRAEGPYWTHCIVKIGEKARRFPETIPEASVARAGLRGGRGI
ncbi:MAG: hypothetical protein LBL45_12865 [Treponema sp.]|nr:hypothetical protein [Treponema sp.]